MDHLILISESNLELHGNHRDRRGHRGHRGDLLRPLCSLCPLWQKITKDRYGLVQPAHRFLFQLKYISQRTREKRIPSRPPLFTSAE